MAETLIIFAIAVSFFPTFSMVTGTIKNKLDKGFGFISVEGSEDVFFHFSACNGQFETLQPGQVVTFDIEEGPKGKKAVNVTTQTGASSH